MEEQQDTIPVWLMPLLETEFYSNCKAHDRKTNQFCLDCKGLVMCERCLDSHRCLGHHILRVYKSSYQVTLRKHDVEGLIDLSDIEIFSCNKHSTIFIHQKKQDGGQINPGTKNFVNCKVCFSQLLPGSKSKFCSIQCKINRSKTIEPERMPLEQESNQCQRSCRKRKRKGNPQRAPLY